MLTRHILWWQEQVRDPTENAEVSMDGFPLKESKEKSEKLLGVVFQPNLKWNAHLVELKGKLKDRITGLTKV